MTQETVPTILLVDDDADLRHAWGRVLSKAGFRVLTAADGREAFEAAQRERPDLVLSDVQMPGVDGVELCRLVRADAGLSATPFVLYSAHRKTSESAVEGLRAGADDYLEAPVEPALLAAKVARHAERGAAAQRQRVLEAELRREGELLRALMDSVPDAIYFKDAGGRFTRVNRHAPYGRHLPPEEVIGRTDFDFFGEADARTFREDEQGVMRTGVPLVDKEECEVHPDGSTTWLLTTKAPVFDGEGRVTGVVGVARDITRRKRAEVALSESERMLRHLARNIPGGSLNVFDRDLRYLFADGQGLKNVGLSPGTLVGKTLSELFPAEAVEYVTPYYRRALAGEPVEFELEVEGRWYSVHAAPLDEAGGDVNSIIVLAQDVSGRKRAEEALAAEKRFTDEAINALLGIFYLLDDTGNFLRWNRAMERVTGYSARELGALHALELFGEEEKSLIAAKISEVFEKGEATAEAHIIGKGGGRTPFLLNGRLLEMGGRRYLVGTGADIYERKRAEGERERLIAELRSALEEVKALRGILPICMYCKNIRNDENFWERVESYISTHTDAQFSHGVCPDCYRKVVEPQLREWKSNP